MFQELLESSGGSGGGGIDITDIEFLYSYPNTTSQTSPMTIPTSQKAKGIVLAYIDSRNNGQFCIGGIAFDGVNNNELFYHSSLGNAGTVTFNDNNIVINFVTTLSLWRVSVAVIY